MVQSCQNWGRLPVSATFVNRARVRVRRRRLKYGALSPLLPFLTPNLRICSTILWGRNQNVERKNSGFRNREGLNDHTFFVRTIMTRDNNFVRRLAAIPASAKMISQPCPSVLFSQHVVREENHPRGAVHCRWSHRGRADSFFVQLHRYTQSRS